MLAHTVVDALVATAQQAEPAARSRAASSSAMRLIEPTATRTQQEQRTRRLGSLDRGEHRLGAHDHAGSTAERRVVDRAMHVAGVLAQVVQPEIEQAAAACLAQQAVRAELVDEPGKMVNTSTRTRAKPTGHHARVIFHIADRDRWLASQAEGRYTASTIGRELADEGFIHLSTADQVAGVQSRFYSGVTNLVLLHVDEALLTAPLVYEQVVMRLRRSPTCTAR